MIQDSFRPLSSIERHILNRLTSVVLPDGDFLKRQVDACLVRTIDEFGSLEFSVSSNERYDDADGPLVTAQQEDVGTVPLQGPYINFILFLRGGMLTELQIYKDDGTPIRAIYDPDKFILTWGLPPKTRHNTSDRP